MKVPPGKSVYIRGRKYKAGAYIPDEMAPPGLKETPAKPPASRGRKPATEGEQPTIKP